MKGVFPKTLGAVCAAALLLSGRNYGLADPFTNTILVTLSDPLTSLGTPVWTNEQVQLALNGETNVSYVIQSSPDLVNWIPAVTNTPAPLIAIAAPDKAGFYRVSRNPLPLFIYAVAARSNILINGNGIMTDSFNSSDTNLSTNGQYDPAKTSTNGNVASVSGIVNIANHTITGSLYLGTNASYASAINQVTAQIYSNYNIQFPDVVLPNVAWQPAPITNVLVGAKSTLLHDFTNANNDGYFTITDSYPIQVEAGVTVTLQVTTGNFDPGFININGGTTNSGSIILYQNPLTMGGSATLPGNSSFGPVGNRPQNFVYLGLPGVTTVEMTGTSTNVGTFYAPQADWVFNAGSTINGFSGSCVGNSIHVNGHFTFHYDESLLTSGSLR